MITVTISNEGGVLDHRVVATESHAAQAAIAMIEAAGELHHGDTITVHDTNEN